MAMYGGHILPHGCYLIIRVICSYLECVSVSHTKMQAPSRAESWTSSLSAKYREDPIARRRNEDSKAGGLCPAPALGERTPGRRQHLQGLALGFAPVLSPLGLSSVKPSVRWDGVGPITLWDHQGLTAGCPEATGLFHEWTRSHSGWLRGVGRGRVGSPVFLSRDPQPEDAVGQGREACVLWNPRGEPH